MPTDLRKPGQLLNSPVNRRRLPKENDLILHFSTLFRYRSQLVSEHVDCYGDSSGTTQCEH